MTTCRFGRSGEWAISSPAEVAPRRRGWSLTTRLVVVAVVPAVVAIVLGGVITVGLTRLTAVSTAEQELRQSVENFERIAPALGATSQQERQRMVRAFLRVEEADVFAVRDGAIVVPEASPFQFARSLDLAALRAGGTLSGRARTSTGEDVVYAAHLVFSAQPRFTQIVVASRPISRLPALPAGGGRLLLAALAAAAVAVVLAVVLGRRLGRPLRDLSLAAASVARGEYGEQVRTDVGGEIGALAADFNAMSKEVETARRREREFIMDVSHDLRTPLTSIRGYAEGILDGTISTDEEKGRAAGVIVGEAARLERLVGDLLSLERLEAGQLRFAFEDVEVCGFLEEVIATRRRAFEQAGVPLRLCVAPGAESVAVRTDPLRLAQVIGNLLDNALRYSPAGAEVRVALRSTDTGAAVAVVDQGPGIAPEDLGRVFERFYVSTRYPGERVAGSGLGLAIVSRIVAALGGRVDVRSEPHRGTVFEMALPSSPQPAAGAPVAQRDGGYPGGGGPYPGGAPDSGGGPYPGGGP